MGFSALDAADGEYRYMLSFNKIQQIVNLIHAFLKKNRVISKIQ